MFEHFFADPITLSKGALAGLTFERLKYYQTSYLLEYGQVEDIPGGIGNIKPAGPQDGIKREYFGDGEGDHKG